MGKIQEAINSLKRNSWGIFLAYALIVGLTYPILRLVIEWLGIPEDLTSLNNYPHFIVERWFVHIIFSLIFSAFITLILDFFFRLQVLKTYKTIISSKKNSALNETLNQYDTVFTEFCKRLSYAIGGYRQHKEFPNKYDRDHVLKRINEVRQSRTRLLSVCGSKIETLLTSYDDDWLHEINLFMQTALKVDEQLATIASADRKSIIEKFL